MEMRSPGVGSSMRGAEMVTPGIGPATEGLSGFALLLDSHPASAPISINAATAGSPLTFMDFHVVSVNNRASCRGATMRGR